VALGWRGLGAIPMTTPPPQGRFKFDMTINVGHVLTVLGLIIVGATAWNAMDKRVLVLEEARLSQRDRDASQDSLSRDKFQEVRDALVDLRRSVEKLADKQGARNETNR